MAEKTEREERRERAERMQQEKHELREQKRIKRAKKIARHRPLKNFLWWFLGFISSFVIVFGSIFVVVKFVPINAFVGNSEQVVSSEIAKKSLFDIVLSKDESGKYVFFKDIKISDVPVLENAVNSVSTQIGLSNYININFDKIKDLEVNKLFGSPELSSCIKISNDLFTTLGLHGDFSVFTETVLVTEPVDPSSEGFNAKLYYYKTADDTYERAFDNDNNYVNGVTSSTPLYYPALSLVPIFDLFDVLRNTVNRVTVSNFLTMVGVAESTIDTVSGFLGETTIGSLINGGFSIEDIRMGGIIDSFNENLKDIFISMLKPENDDEWDYRDITVGDLMESDFSLNGIKLSAFWSEPDSKTEELLVTITKPEGAESWGYEDITINDLMNSGLSLDNVKLSTFWSTPDSKTKELLAEATKPEGAESWSYEDITISDLMNSGLSLDNVKLSTFWSDADSDTKELLVAITKPEGAESWEYEDITINDLMNSGLSLDKVKLSTFWSDADETTKSVLVSATKPTGVESWTYEDITVSTLKNLDVQKIYLKDVVDFPDEAHPDRNKELYDILSDVFEDVDTVTLNNLTSFSIENIRLTTVVKRNEDNAQLYSILNDVFEDVDSVTVSQLKNFDVNEVKLGTVLPESHNEKIYVVLKDALTVPEGKTVEDLRLYEINDNFAIENIKLKSVISSSSNAIINSLIEQDVTVGELGSQLNSLSLYDIYGKECFTLDEAKAMNTEDRYIYNEEQGTYTLSASGTYYRAHGQGIWILMCFDAINNENGKTVVFTKSDLTMNDLQTGGNCITDKIKNATIRQLVDVEMIEDPEYTGIFETMYTKTISDALKFA